MSSSSYLYKLSLTYNFADRCSLANYRDCCILNGLERDKDYRDDVAQLSLPLLLIHLLTPVRLLERLRRVIFSLG